MSLTVKDGLETEGIFFRDKIIAIKESLSQESYKNFCNINSDEERIRFIYNLDAVHNMDLPETPFKKNSENALNCKNQGNTSFGKQNFEQAAKLYSQAILDCPSSEDILLSTLYANRSAAYYFLNQYKNSLQDIELCLMLPYPEDLQYKVLERRARCHLALNNLKKAIDDFKSTMPSLLKSKLDSQNRQKKEYDISIMIALLSKTLSEGAPKKKPDAAKDVLPPVPKLAGKKNQNYPAASDLIRIERNPTEGRYGVANSEIKTGEVLMIENAQCFNLLSEYSKTHCQHCFIRVSYSIPCSNCPSIIFCSTKCRQIAMNSYHKYECSFLGALWVSEISLICNLSVRLLTQKGLDYFIKIRTKLGKNLEENEIYDPADYKILYNMCRHENKRTHFDFFQRSVMAIILLKYLQRTKFFPTEPNRQLTDAELYVGQLLLHNLQVTQFNAHEIAELQFHADFPGDLERAKSAFIGGGVFPTLALLNHSCEPGIVRYFSGSQVIVKAVKPIAPGKPICENYGPIYTQVPRETRRSELKLRYWFDCNCTPCTEDWPVFNNMTTDVLRFRCIKERSCPGIMFVKLTTDEFMFTCPVCKEQICIFGGLKQLNDTEELFKKGERFMKNQLYNDALQIFIRIMHLLDLTLAPPYKDFCICQQKIRSCMLTFGNSYQKAAKKT